MTEQDPPLWSYHGQQANASSFVTMLIHLYRAEVSRAMYGARGWIRHQLGGSDVGAA
jgi:hypothetical protein